MIKAEDINRVMMSMPGVASTSDQINELVVRSGKPTKNLTDFDGIETHSSHFGVQDRTGDVRGKEAVWNVNRDI